MDAMFRQVSSTKTLPFKSHSIPGLIHASDYDLGAIGEAYYDIQSGNFQVSTGEFTTWNDGWQYRNDGVDIEVSTNTVNSNGYNVGFMDAGEWMQYEVNVEESGVYEAHVRVASGGSGGLFHFSMDGGDITTRSFIGPSGGWQNWRTVVVPNIIINEGDKKLRFHTDVAGYNLASFEFIKTDVNSSDLSTVFVGAETVDEMTIQVNLNKVLDPTFPSSPAGFEVTVNGAIVPINSVSLDGENNRIVKIGVDYIMNSTEQIRVSYAGVEIMAIDDTPLLDFTLETVRNNLDFVHQIPGRIEAEAFDFQSGIVLEETTDTGGGENIGFLDVDDYLDYEVNIPESGNYRVDYRTAGQFGTGGVQVQLIDRNDNVNIINDVSFSSTGGWQTWRTTSQEVTLPEGRYTMRILITRSPFNMNWLSFDFSTSTKDLGESINEIQLFPNPTSDFIILSAILNEPQTSTVKIYDLFGNLLLRKPLSSKNKIDENISIVGLPQGQYILKLELENQTTYVDRFTVIKD